MYIVFAIIVLLIPALSYAKTIDVVGLTYSIAESDALKEMQKRVKQTDWNKYFDRQKAKDMIKSHRPGGVVSLPKAEEDRAFSIDLTYTVKADIPDGRGGILYPKGYSFNPLDFVVFPNTLIFIDGNDKNQVQWYIENFSKKIGGMVLLVDGPFFSLSEQLRIPVFYATREIIEKFRIQRVPSTVKQVGRVMEVREHQLPLNHKNRN